MARLRIDRILETAVRCGASDVWMIPGIPPVLRIDGGDRGLEMGALEHDDVVSLMKGIIPESNQSELASGGRSTWAFAFGSKARIRASATRHAGGLALSLRVHARAIPAVEDWGLPEIVKGLCRRPRGLLIVAGPPGCGKTTLLGTLVDYVARACVRRIVTLESVIELVYPGTKLPVVQRAVGEHVASIADGLRDARSMRADVVQVGELDGPATLSAVLDAAEHDCLVLAPGPGRGAANVVAHLCRALGSAEEEARARVTQALIGIISLELCVRHNEAGMVPACEFMAVTPGVTAAIGKGEFAKIDDAIRAGEKYGMRRLDDSLFALYAAGKVYRDVAINHALAPAEMQQRIEAHRRQQGDGPGDLPLPDPFPVRPDRPPPGLSAHAESPEGDEPPRRPDSN